jgi:hypothetical protein
LTFYKEYDKMSMKKVAEFMKKDDIKRDVYGSIF